MIAAIALVVALTALGLTLWRWHVDHDRWLDVEEMLAGLELFNEEKAAPPGPVDPRQASVDALADVRKALGSRA